MSEMANQLGAIAFYLPQFHPTPENDLWWGKGFTEWTNVAQAKKLYPGHLQPVVPADLGFYDLRLAETREAQADLAKKFGISGFCYWHYWFGGRRILERPFQEVLDTKKPDFPFCLGWANGTWSGIWVGAKDKILIEQTYPGPEDSEKHFQYLLDAFNDPRYLKLAGKPIFLIYKPLEIPYLTQMIEQWRNLARASGLKGLHLIGVTQGGDVPFDAKSKGLDGICNEYQAQLHAYATNKDFQKRLEQLNKPEGASFFRRIKYVLSERSLVWKYKLKRKMYKILGWPAHLYQYRDALKYFLPIKKYDYGVTKYAAAVPRWDHSPRCGKISMILHGSTPELFRRHICELLAYTNLLPQGERIFFIKSWNEWAEGNYMEPDLHFGTSYLQVFHEEICRVRKSN